MNFLTTPLLCDPTFDNVDKMKIPIVSVYDVKNSLTYGNENFRKALCYFKNHSNVRIVNPHLIKEMTIGFI